jgi:hypothetical protein
LAGKTLGRDFGNIAVAAPAGRDRIAPSKIFQWAQRAQSFLTSILGNGCIRLPKGMAQHFFDASREGTPVIVKE